MTSRVGRYLKMRWEIHQTARRACEGPSVAGAQALTRVHQECSLRRLALPHLSAGSFFPWPRRSIVHYLIRPRYSRLAPPTTKQ